MRVRTVRTATAVAALLTAGLAPLAVTAPAHAAAAEYADDFNGDGYRDVAIGAPYADVGSADSAGAVVVLYGTSSAVSGSTKRTVITQNSTGVAGTAEDFDFFGSSLTSADLDGDGYADLVVGAPGENIGSQDGVGQATILWGGKSGLSGGSTVPQPSGLSEWGSFSAGVAAADFNGDGAADLTITGQSATRLYRGPFTRKAVPYSQGTVNTGSTYDVISGDLNGDGAAERLYPFAVGGDEGGDIGYYSWTGTKYAKTELTSADGDLGSIGDVNGDGYGDLVLGNYQDPYSGAPDGHKGGQIAVWYGSATGPDVAQTPTLISQDTAGVPDAGEAGDMFGESVSVGDVNGDGYADVAVGAPGENLGTGTKKRDAGSVTLLFGSATGLSGHGAERYTQDTAGVPGTAEKDDAFGAAVRLIDLNRNGRAELVADAADENGYGAITVLRGTGSGLTTSSARTVTARDVSLKGSAAFGSAIAQ